MKKLINTLLILLFAVAILFTAGVLLLPDAVQSLWQKAGLPQTPLARILALTGGGAPSGRHELRFYGTLEARTFTVMSELPGRASAVLVDEGDRVEAGEILIRLAPDDVQAQMAAAEESVAAARAARTAVAAPPDKSVVTLADQKVAAARIDLENARRSLKDAQEMVANPLALDAQINQTASLIPVAKANIDAAQASVKQLTVLLTDAQGDGSREGKYKAQMLQAQKTAAEQEVKAAQARLDGLYRSYALLKKMRETPLELLANQHQAESAVNQAEAALAVAQTERALQIASPQPEAIAVADAQVQKARAALATVRWQVDRLQLSAPVGGRVQAKMLESGETVRPGAPLLTIADDSRMEVWVYVSAQDLHRVHLGDRLPVAVLAVPDRLFEADVFFIADQAQFRPNNVLNPDDRGDMVFLVKLYLANEEGLFKPGMPADVIMQR